MTSNPAMNIAEALSYGKQQLNTDSAALDAELLLCEAIERARTYLFTWPETPLTPEQTDRFKNLIEARSQGTPVAYLLGEKEFWGMTFEVTPDTLIPRP
ncbi:MAG: protein-(glutamine-N5) methyltransferase, release factor-specific, partial [Hydrogenovibrio sp.]|nr:protein-(glutamine-N5) methyltransferase, release factor-specific [Hydrogenovibrio sp.]